MATGFNVLLLILQCFFAIEIGYLLILTFAAWRAPRITPTPGTEPSIQFAFLIPAYNEELLLPSCLASLARIDYPSTSYSVHVVADNCTDLTARVAESGYAKVHVRHDPLLRGKGYALQWLLERLERTGEAYDAGVILDADSVISPNFLRVMAARLERGETAIQAYYTVRAPERSWNGSLRYAALAVLHFLRPQGRMVLGGSAGLKGNGMVFRRDILRRHTWSASVTEDIEYHMALLMDGLRVTFAPDAIVWGEMPDTLAGSRSQQARWESGRLQMARKYVPRLIKSSVEKVRQGQFRQAFLLFDAVMEHVIPPFSLLLGTGVVLWALDLLLSITPSGGHPWLVLSGTGLSTKPAAINLIFGTVLLAAQAFYLFAGLFLVKAPGRIYRSLLFSPVFIIWKIGQYIQVLLGRDQRNWVRTARNQRS